MMTIVRVEIAEIENRNIYRVWHHGAVLIERTTSPMRAAARVLLDRGVAGLDDELEMVRRGSDQVDMRATISDAAGPDDNSDPLGIGHDPADYSGLSDDGPLPTTSMRKATHDSRERRQSASETDIVAMLDGGRRVIADPVQWILQVQRPNGSWSNRSYCRTKEALIRCCGGSTPELDALPDRIGDRVAPTTTDRQEAAE
jgi:hypothetical protein